MIEASDRIVVGVSGGADSVCLLLLLMAYGERVPLSLTVVHVNHGIRSDAGEDARYVEELCAREGVAFRLAEADVRRLAKERKCSEEDAGRWARYEAFRRVARETGSNRIALAHNSNDNAETMLFHLFRGSGLRGLSGIPPMREEVVGSEDGSRCLCAEAVDSKNGSGCWHEEVSVRENGFSCLWVIRPLLCLERQEIEDYLRGRQVTWRTDSTNDTNDYRRNRIRHDILPYAEQEISSGIVGHMRQTSELLRETEDYLEQQTQAAIAACVMPAEAGKVCKYVIDMAAFRKLHVILQRCVLLELMKRLSPTGKDISFVHVRNVEALCQEEGVRSVCLPFGIIVLFQYGKLTLERTDCVGEARQEEVFRGMPLLAGEAPVALPPAEELFLRPFSCSVVRGKIEFSAFFCKKGQKFPKNQYTKWFDYDKIKESLIVRPRMKGDFLTISRETGDIAHKSLKNYMVTEKIPRQIRDRIPVLAAGSHVLWLVGWRISEAFKVDGNTKCILQARFTDTTQE